MGVYVVIYIHIILFFGGSGEAAVFLLYCVRNSWTCAHITDTPAAVFGVASGLVANK
jgi:hypothetical protein